MGEGRDAEGRGGRREIFCSVQERNHEEARNAIALKLELRGQSLLGALWGNKEESLGSPRCLLPPPPEATGAWRSVLAHFSCFEGSCWWEQDINDACATRPCCLLTMQTPVEIGLFLFCLTFSCPALGFSSEKWNSVEMTPRKVTTYNCEAPLTDATFSPWRQISTLLGTSHPHVFTRLVSSLPPSCLCLQRSGITDVHH